MNHSIILRLETPLFFPQYARPVPRRLKILMSAYACEPNKGSEPGVGWHWALQMSRFHNVWVLTRANNRSTIEEFRLTPEQQNHIHWVYFDLPPWAMTWKKGSRGVQVYYYLWQLAVWRRGLRLHREIGFDLLHHVTFGKYWVPCYLAFLPIKTILGPLGGGESTPPALTGAIRWPGRIFEFARNLARGLADLDLPARAIMRRASVVFATTEETKKRVERMGAARATVEAQVGMDDEQIEYFGRFPVRTETPFRLISIGRLLHWKGFHLGLQAFARFQQLCPDSEYWIVSDGPEARAWQQLAQRLGIASRVTFWGRLPQIADVYEKLAQSDVLVHPALHEAFGNVCLEALAAGRPVICLDTGGPGLQVTPACGFKAPVTSLEAAVQSMADAMTQLHRSPELRLRMAAAARQRVRSHFHWERKAEHMNAMYQEICQAGAGSKLRS
ncbi:MAG: glycosyltransferase [Verrucomicrobia subdivision 3 bacterium]|nr:glycosyltransferase [Verrucomicrobiota bacterium]MCC6819543.1 glycosyltransferase [Limisphaerales bacterium]